MHYHLIMTHLCNSKCSYCFSKSIVEENDLNKKFRFNFSSPSSFKVDLLQLKKFIESDQEAVICFYGGEPLLEMEKIIEIMKNIDVPYRMQTNGKLLDKMPIEWLNRIDKLLISIDGDKNRTDLNRGEGTYEVIMKNIEKVRLKGYKGEIIARMTLSFPDVYEQAIYLINNGFESIHWQIDAGFYKCDFDEKKFATFVKEYKVSLEKLINYWIKHMKDSGKVIKIYPFLGIVDSLLKNEDTLLRCGAGHKGFAISTNGKIYPCPVMDYMEDFIAGDISFKPSQLKKFYIEGDCLSCNYFKICGGRCLYWNRTQLWPKKGNEMICKTIKHLIELLKNSLPDIKEMLEEGRINIDNLKYEKYFGPEIIP
ncbi:MAG: TIGR04084 family radical SAM/SPASM domain-containing protein [Candidatus Pacearchaeota archaeon]